MNNKLRIVLIAVLSCALVVCVAMMVRSYIQETEGEAIYSDAIDEFISIGPIADQPTQPPPVVGGTTAPHTTQGEEATTPTTEGQETTAMPTTAAATRPIIMNAEDISVDFDKLKAVNSDILGWIVIENTTISYPVLQGADNEKYLTTTYNNKYSKYGSIYIDYRLDATFDIPHTVIYGHNMRNSSMFGTLLKYSTQSYWKNRKYFHILLPDGMLKYEIFSAYKADITGSTYTVRFNDDAAKEKWLQDIIALSDVDMGVVPEVGDKVVTLSTCTSNSNEKSDKRYVVHGRLILDTRTASGEAPAGTTETAPPDTTVPGDTTTEAATTAANG